MTLGTIYSERRFHGHISEALLIEFYGRTETEHCPGFQPHMNFPGEVTRNGKGPGESGLRRCDQQMRTLPVTSYYGRGV